MRLAKQARRIPGKQMIVKTPKMTDEQQERFCIAYSSLSLVFYEATKNMTDDERFLAVRSLNEMMTIAQELGYVRRTKDWDGSEENIWEAHY